MDRTEASRARDCTALAGSCLIPEHELADRVSAIHRIKQVADLGSGPHKRSLQIRKLDRSVLNAVDELGDLPGDGLEDGGHVHVSFESVGSWVTLARHEGRLCLRPVGLEQVVEPFLNPRLAAEPPDVLSEDNGAARFNGPVESSDATH